MISRALMGGQLHGGEASYVTCLHGGIRADPVPGFTPWQHEGNLRADFTIEQSS